MRSSTDRRGRQRCTSRLFETYRKSSESWLQMQQDMFRNVAQQWMATPPSTAGMATRLGTATFQKRWLELARRDPEPAPRVARRDLPVVDPAPRADLQDVGAEVLRRIPARRSRTCGASGSRPSRASPRPSSATCRTGPGSRWRSSRALRPSRRHRRQWSTSPDRAPAARRCAREAVARALAVHRRR